MLATFVVVVAYARFRKGPELVLAHNPLPPYRGIPDHSTAREGDIQYCIATPEIRRRALPYGHPMTPPRSMAEIFIPLDEGPSFQPSIFAEGVPLAHSDVQPFRRVIGREVVPCPDGFVEVRFEEFSSSRTAWAEEILTAPSQFKANSSIYNLEWRVFSLANAQTLWDVSQFFLVQGGVMSAISFLVMVFQIIFPISSHNTPQDISDGFCNDQPKVISHPDIDEASETLAGSTSNPPLVADVSGEIVANHDVLEQSFSSFSLELQNPLVFDSFADFGPPVASSTEADVAKMLLISEPSFTVDFVLPLSSPSAVDKGKVVQLEDDHEQITPNDASHTVDDLSLPEIVAPVSRSSSVCPAMRYCYDAG
ncbi:hypothetical protein CPB83DRAFT_687007 [Crepidotus variabilis]|uniref:Uncharacterized protein n=1 Tax=Crepidotus variabilis TaxID=179855 RepID=A0A9P6JK81_9AGAR|nr:hypothetical protein CPB83DRAFT_687007 [Crepidotus variabilis]